MDKEQHLRMLNTFLDMVDAKEALPWWAFVRRNRAQREINYQLYNIFQHQHSTLAGIARKTSLLNTIGDNNV